MLDLEWIGAGKNWHDCKALVEKQGKRMLNMAELFYVIWKHDEMAKKLLDWDNDVCYTWTSSLAVGGSVASAGRWGSRGPFAGRDDATSGWDRLGLLFSCTDL